MRSMRWFLPVRRYWPSLPSISGHCHGPAGRLSHPSPMIPPGHSSVAQPSLDPYSSPSPSPSPGPSTRTPHPMPPPDDRFRPLLERWGELWGVPGLPSRVTILPSTRLRRSLGRCQPATGRISIRASLLDGDPRLLEEVLCHEAAHGRRGSWRAPRPGRTGRNGGGWSGRRGSSRGSEEWRTEATWGTRTTRRRRVSGAGLAASRTSTGARSAMRSATPTQPKPAGGAWSATTRGRRGRW
jgi:hypothetical protein